MKYILMFILLTSCTLSTPAKGSKVGKIVHISHRGIINKTWEFELIRGGLIDGSGSFGASTFFTIEDDENLEIANLALKNNSEIEVFYRVEGIASVFRSEFSTPYFVEHIEICK